MILDKQTQKDLEIFPSFNPSNDKEERESVLKKLDRTRFSGGSIFLEKLFQNPLKDESSIQRSQEALQHLMQNYALWQDLYNLVQKDHLDQLKKYLQSNILSFLKNEFFTDLLKSYELKLFYPDIYFQLTEGIRNTVELLTGLNKFNRLVYSDNLPPLLSELLFKIRSVLETEEIIEIGSIDNVHSLSGLKIITLDTKIRDKMKSLIQTVLDLIGELDARISMATACIELGLTLPKFHRKNKPLLKIKGLFHPFLAQPIRNDYHSGHDKNFLFLSGPNMAGKSTYMKACGISVYLAHLGMGVPAEEMELTRFDHLITSINTDENIHLGYSYFYSEVKRVKEIAHILKTKEKSFVIMDELFKGTNIKDAYDATLLVIQAMLRFDHSLFILSTHLIELEPDISTYPNIEYHYFDAEIKHGHPEYRYRLKKGISSQRLGMTILKNEKILELLGIEEQVK